MRPALPIALAIVFLIVFYSASRETPEEEWKYVKGHLISDRSALASELGEGPDLPLSPPFEEISSEIFLARSGRVDYSESRRTLNPEYAVAHVMRELTPLYECKDVNRGSPLPENLVCPGNFSGFEETLFLEVKSALLKTPLLAEEAKALGERFRTTPLTFLALNGKTATSLGNFSVSREPSYSEIARVGEHPRTIVGQNAFERNLSFSAYFSNAPDGESSCISFGIPNYRRVSVRISSDALLANVSSASERGLSIDRGENWALLEYEGNAGLAAEPYPLEFRACFFRD